LVYFADSACRMDIIHFVEPRPISYITMQSLAHSEQVTMCLEVLRDLWDRRKPFIDDFWLPDYATAASSSQRPASEQVAEATNRAAAILDVPATAPPDPAAVGSAIAMLTQATNALDREMSTDDGALRRRITAKDATAASRLYCKRSELRRVYMGENDRLPALLDALRAIAFDTSAAAKPYALAILAAQHADLGGVAAEIAKNAASHVSDPQERSCVAQVANTALPASRITAGTLPPPQSALVSRGGGGGDGSGIVGPILAGDAERAGQTRAELQMLLDAAVTLLRHVWQAELPAYRDVFLRDWLTKAPDVMATPAQLGLLRSKSAEELKAMGNDAWVRYSQLSSSPTTETAAEAIAAWRFSKLAYTAALAKLDIEGTRLAASAVEVDGEDQADALRKTASQVYNNRSLLHLRLGDNLRALLDAVYAALQDTAALKPHYRGMVAAKAAGDVKLALRFARSGLQRGGGDDPAFAVEARALLSVLSP
jgi:hypothetical protein